MPTPPQNLDVAELALRAKVVRGDDALRCCMRAHSNISLSLEMAHDLLEEAFALSRGARLEAFAPRILPLPGRVSAPPLVGRFLAPKLILAPLELFRSKEWFSELPVPQTAPELAAVQGVLKGLATGVRNASRDNCLPCVWSHTLGQSKVRRTYYGTYRTREQ